MVLSAPAHAQFNAFAVSDSKSDIANAWNIKAFNIDYGTNYINSKDPKSMLMQEIISLAIQSLADESEKFEEALEAVMTQRVQEYM